MALRDNFPPAGDEFMGGYSDGWCYETVFAGSNLQHSLDMIATFLEEEGYGDVPLPNSAEDLLLFKIPTRNRQIVLFEENGYAHNPVKILFPEKSKIKSKLILRIYNEAIPDHLIKFHNVIGKKLN